MATTLRKYLFDRDFGAPRPQPAPEIVVIAPEEPPPPPSPPTFSEAELASARQAAYGDGRAAGLKEAAAAAERRQADALAALADALRALVADWREDAVRRQREAFDLGMAVLRRLQPELARRHALEEIGGVVHECLARLDAAPRLSIRVNPAHLDGVRAEAERVVADMGFDGKIVFAGDAHVAPGDCRVEWGDGGAERDQARLWEEIESILARAFAEGDAAAPAGERPSRSE